MREASRASVIFHRHKWLRRLRGKSQLPGSEAASKPIQLSPFKMTRTGGAD
jgi:hypothetical protein